MFSHSMSFLLLIIFILTFSAVSFIYTPITAQSPAERQYKEDFNGDGTANISDVISLLLFQRSNPGDLDGDYNGDGTASVTDAIAMLLAIRGGDLTPVSPVEVAPGDTVSVRGIEMVYIPSGGYGTEPKIISVDSFWVSRTEITQQQFLSVMGWNYADHYGDNLPSDYVSWYDAARFCSGLSFAAGLDPCYDIESWECDFTKNGFRLLTETEWEYAARAGTSTPYYTGSTAEDLNRAAWYKDNSGYVTHPVGLKEPNSWGLYDMLGNVREWVNDWYISTHPVNYAPIENYRGPETGTKRVMKGGNIGSSEYLSQVTTRSSNDPGSSAGFRIARVGDSFPRERTHNISGRVIENGRGMPGSVVRIKGVGVWEILTTDATGTYSLAGLVDGTYRIFPDSAGYVFSSPGLQVTVDGADVSVPDIFADTAAHGDSVLVQGIALTSVPSGEFMMGTTDTSYAWRDARPQHMVHIDSFMISQTEITQLQYRSITNALPPPPENPGVLYIDSLVPVVEVTWQEAATFCNNLSELSGLESCYDPVTWECDFSKSGFRLPTEAEWEYAARATINTAFPNGDNPSELDQTYWTDIAPVGSREPNAWGIYDMQGNASEWCNDMLVGTFYYYYMVSPIDNPTSFEVDGVRYESNRKVRGKGFAGRGGIAYQTGFRVVTRTREFDTDYVVNASVGGMIDLRGKVSLEIPPGVFNSNFTARVEETTPNSIPRPPYWNWSEFNNLQSLGTAVKFTFESSSGVAPEPDPSSGESIKISFRVSELNANLEDLVIAYTKDHNGMRFLQPEYDPASGYVSGYIPVAQLAAETSTFSTVQLQGYLDYWPPFMIHAYMLNVQNQNCKGEDSAELLPYYFPGGDKIPVIFVHGWQPPYQSCAAMEFVEPFTHMRKFLWNSSNWGITENCDFYTFAYSTFFKIEYNGELLKTKIDEQFGDVDNIVLICHSMGGLVARYYVEKLGGDAHVNTVITCGTPHRGSTLADDAGPFLPTGGTFSLKPDVINKIFGGGVSDLFINYAGDISDSPAESIHDKLMLYAQRLQPDKVGDGIVPLESAIPGGARRDSIFKGYDHIEMQDGLNELGPEAKGSDPLFQAVYRDLRDIFSVLPEDLEMVTLSGGIFSMGDTTWGIDEIPIHKVNLGEFKMSATEITQYQWYSVMGLPWPSSSLTGSDYPVTPSLDDIKFFCDRLSVICGLDPCYEKGIYDEDGVLLYDCDFSKNGFRLPTEAEWEYAARAGNRKNFCNGDSLYDLARVGWYESNSGGKFHEVARKTPNAFGLYDMHGNVWEYCNDYYDPGYYVSSLTTEPEGPFRNNYYNSLQHRVIRGGGFASDGFDCRSSNRSTSGDAQYDIGFRIVCRGQFPPD